MLFKGLLFVFLIISVKSVQIDVLVESLCPDCMGFISQSFAEFFKAENHHLLANVTFYPYGNAHQSFDGTRWNFVCQHGANECYGNLIETCVVRQFTPEFSHNFLICLEGNILSHGKDFKAASDACLTNQPQTVLDTIWNCVNSDVGNSFQHEVADFTEKVNPPHKYVPWIIVDGTHDAKVEDAIMNDMLGYLCQHSRLNIPACETRSEFLNSFFEEKNHSKCYRN
jgi:interferon gamma-inducible protein 30